MDNQWFRMYHEFATDAKVQMLSESDQRRLVMLLCLHRANPEKQSIEELAFYLRITTNEMLQTGENLIQAGLLDSNLKPIKPLEIYPERPPANVWKEIRERIFKRDNYTCGYCGEIGKRLECDHVVPVSKGGSHDDENLVTSCFKCNRSKAAKLLTNWVKAHV